MSITGLTPERATHAHFEEKPERATHAHFAEDWKATVLRAPILNVPAIHAGNPQSKQPGLAGPRFKAPTLVLTPPKIAWLRACQANELHTLQTQTPIAYAFYSELFHTLKQYQQAIALTGAEIFPLAPGKYGKWSQKLETGSNLLNNALSPLPVLNVLGAILSTLLTLLGVFFRKIDTLAQQKKYHRLRQRLQQYSTADWEILLEFIARKLSVVSQSLLLGFDGSPEFTTFELSQLCQKISLLMFEENSQIQQKCFQNHGYTLLENLVNHDALKTLFQKAYQKYTHEILSPECYQGMQFPIEIEEKQVNPIIHATSAPENRFPHGRTSLPTPTIGFLEPLYRKKESKAMFKQQIDDYNAQMHQHFHQMNGHMQSLYQTLNRVQQQLDDTQNQLANTQGRLAQLEQQQAPSAEAAPFLTVPDIEIMRTPEAPSAGCLQTPAYLPTAYIPLPENPHNILPIYTTTATGKAQNDPNLPHHPRKNPGQP